MQTKKSAQILWAILILIASQIPASAFAQGTCLDLFSKDVVIAAEARKKSPFAELSENQIVLLLKALDPLINVSARAIKVDNSEVGRDKIRELTLIDATPAQLYSHVTRKREGKWSEWLQKAGLLERDASPRNPFRDIDDAKITELIQALSKKISIYSSNIEFDNSAAGKKVIKDLLKIEATASQLFYYIINIKKEVWGDWLEKAGLPRVSDSNESPFRLLTENQIVELIQALDKVISVYSTDIEYDRSQAGKRVIKKIAGIDAVASALFTYIKRNRHEVWGDWLVKAGLPRQAVTKASPFEGLSDAKIIELVQALDKVILVNVKAIESDRSEAGKKVIKEITGLEATASQLLSYVVTNQNQSWRDLLEKAKLEHRIRKETRRLKDDEIIKVIQALAADSYALNYSAMFADNTVDSGLRIKQITGIYTTPARLIDQVILKENVQERIWDYWIVKAGLNPFEIRLRGNTPAFLLNSALKGELDSNYQAIAKGGLGFENNLDGTRSQKVIVDNTTPESLLAREEFYQTLKKVISDLTPRQAQLFENMLDYFETHSYSEMAGMGDYLRVKIGPETTDQEWQSLLGEVAKHDELRELLLDL